MFQYAFALYLSEKHQTNLKADVSYLLRRDIKDKNHVFRNYDLDVFDLNVDLATQTEVNGLTRYLRQPYLNAAANKLMGRKSTYIVETDMSFMPTAFNAGGNVYLEGYWQSEKYFAPVADILKKLFVIKAAFPAHVNELIKEISGQNSVCVNIRRGDFVNSLTHGVCSPEYYNKAEKLLSESQANMVFYVFSDDLEWCKQNLKFFCRTVFVDHAFAGPKFAWYFHLMTCCKHFIIANSSFAWWAAYLAPHQNKTVIAPSKWVIANSLYNADIYPDAWLTI